jgi:hypothetical protein
MVVSASSLLVGAPAMTVTVSETVTVDPMLTVTVLRAQLPAVVLATLEVGDGVDVLLAAIEDVKTGPTDVVMLDITEEAVPVLLETTEGDVVWKPADEEVADPTEDVTDPEDVALEEEEIELVPAPVPFPEPPPGVS